MRAHCNPPGDIVSVLLVMLFHLAFGADTTWVLALCGTFAFGGLTHAAAHFAANQPSPAGSFVIGPLRTVVARVQVMRAAPHLVA